MAVSITSKNNNIRKCAPPLKNKIYNSYLFDYEYYPGTRKASRIGNRHYLYDLNGNLTAEKDGPFEAAGQSSGGQIRQTGNGTNYVEGGWGLDGGTGGANAAANLREYRWNERNRMTESIDSRYNVKYTYGHDGERTGKHAKTRAGGSESETLYFNRMWNWRYDGLLSDRTGTNSKHVFLGDTRILTKVITADGSFTAAERVRQYYYHSDHLGSAQLITDYKGDEYERLEYTPYGEMWIDKAPAVSVIEIPYRFTGKERDSETGLYYYGARYLDSRTGRWLSGDTAVSEYIPSAPVDDEARKRNESLPGQGGVFNYVNLHAYHYAGNNPVKYTDPDGNYLIYNKARGARDAKQYVLRNNTTWPRYVEVGSNVFYSNGITDRPQRVSLLSRHDQIELENGLEKTLSTVLRNKDDNTSYKVEARAEMIELNVYQIELTITKSTVNSEGEIDTTTQSGIIGFVDNKEIEIMSGGRFGDDRQHGVNRIANEIISIVLNQRKEVNLVE